MWFLLPEVFRHRKIIKKINEFAKKLHDISSKVENIYVGLKNFVSDEI